MMLRYVLMLVCLLLAFGCAQAAAKTWKLDHIVTTMWCPPPVTEENLARLAAEHFTMTWVGADGLDLCAKHGLRAMLTDGLINPATLDDPAQKAKLDALIDKVNTHPALYAYYLRDEPSAGDFTALGRLVAYLRERDPAHLAYINLFPTYANNQQLGTEGDTETAYAEHLRQFIAVVKPALISYDHYHWFKNHDGEQYFLNLGMIRKAALDAGLPFLNIVQTSDGEKSWRYPTGDELRWLVYTTLAYGGRGLSYFVYWGMPAYRGLYDEGKAMPLAADAATLNAEIAALSPELMALDSLGAYSSEPLPKGAEAVPADAAVQITGPGEFVLGLFGAGGKASAFMIVNRSYRDEQAARLRVPAGTRAVQEFDHGTRAWRNYAVPGASGAVTVDLQPGDGRLFRLL